MIQFRKLKTGLVICTALVLMMVSCKKNENKNSSEGITVVEKGQDAEALSDEDAEILANKPEAIDFNSSTIVLPNGRTVASFLQEFDPLYYYQGIKTADIYNTLDPQGAKNLLIARMTGSALNLIDRSKHQKTYDGDGKPAQNGLAYSWGSKDHTIRQFPSTYTNPPSVCTHKIYGLDCSGLIYRLFFSEGVILPFRAEDQRKLNDLQKAISKAIPKLNKIKIEDLGLIPTSKFETGDIVYWIDQTGVAFHIGMVFQDFSGKLAVYQSNGQRGDNENECLVNLSIKKGPRILEFNNPFWFGPKAKYSAVRINTEINESCRNCEGNGETSDINDVGLVSLKIAPGVNDFALQTISTKKLNEGGNIFRSETQRAVTAKDFVAVPKSKNAKMTWYSFGSSVVLSIQIITPGHILMNTYYIMDTTRPLSDFDEKD